MFGVSAVSDIPVAIKYPVTGFAIVLAQELRQIAMLLGDTPDLLAPSEPLQIIEIDQRHWCECIDDVHLEIVAKKDRCVTAGRRPGTVCLSDMR